MQRKLKFLFTFVALILFMAITANAQQQSVTTKDPAVATKALKVLMKKVDDLALLHRELELNIVKEKRDLDLAVQKGDTSGVAVYLLGLQKVDKVHLEHHDALAAVGKYHEDNFAVIPGNFNIAPWFRVAIEDRERFDKFSKEYDPLQKKEAPQ